MEEKLNKRKIGSMQEKRAEKFLEKNGILIVERNFRCRSGEIDLIGYDKEYLIFIEVKYRHGTVSGSPAEAVGSSKQRIICRVADYYRYCKKIVDTQPVRYDVVAMTDEEIVWYRNAFDHRW